MMSDPVRMSAYRHAIALRCPDKVVCEIGVGLGPLSLMALKAGAKRVYGVEVDPEALEMAVRIMAANGFGPDRFIPVCGLSTHVFLREKVDVILSETLDSAGIGENTVHFMADARQRLLKPDGCFIPEGLDCYLALASPKLYADKLAYWIDELKRQDMDYSPIEEELRQVQHAFEVKPGELLSPWIRWQHIDFNDPDSFEQRTSVAAQATSAGTVTGFATAFDARLAPGVNIRTFPKDPVTHWAQGFCAFPESPVTCAVGDLVFMELRVVPHGTRWAALKKNVVSGEADEVLRYIAHRVAAVDAEDEGMYDQDESIQVA